MKPKWPICFEVFQNLYPSTPFINKNKMLLYSTLNCIRLSAYVWYTVPIWGISPCYRTKMYAFLIPYKICQAWAEYSWTKIVLSRAGRRKRLVNEVLMDKLSEWRGWVALDPNLMNDVIQELKYKIKLVLRLCIYYPGSRGDLSVFCTNTRLCKIQCKIM